MLLFVYQSTSGTSRHGSELYQFSKWGEDLIQNINVVKESLAVEGVNVVKTSPATKDLEFLSRSYVTSERSVRWEFAWQLLQENYFVVPMGFGYQEKFGCRFLECKTNDYPHNVFLSEFLVAGLLSLGLCILIFCRHFLNLFSLKNADVKRKLLVLSFFALPNLLISGDYFFTSGMSVAVIVLSMISSYEQKQFAETSV